MKNIKTKTTAFKPKTPEAKELLKKVKEFNKLVDYFKSDDAKKILEEGLHIKKGEKYSEVDDKDPSKIHNFISPKNFRIDFDYYGKSNVYIDMVNVGVSGKIGKKVVEEIQMNGQSYCEQLNYKQITTDFKPTKRIRSIELEEVLSLKKDDIEYDSLREVVDAFAKQGVECKFTFELDVYNDKVKVKDFLMNDSDFDKLYEEVLPLNIPCLLHENRADKARVKKLKAEGYIEKMITTKVENQMKRYFAKTNTKEVFRRYEFNFSGNSLLTFRKAELQLHAGKKDSNMSWYSNYEVKTIKNK